MSRDFVLRSLAVMFAATLLLAGCDDPRTVLQHPALVESRKQREAFVQEQMPAGCTYREIAKLTDNGGLSGNRIHLITCEGRRTVSWSTDVPVGKNSSTHEGGVWIEP